MSYTPKHAARVAVNRPLVRVAATGAALVGASLAIAPSAQADPNNVWDRVADCESGGNWHINTGNGYYGGLQFSYGTWKAYGGQQYARTADKASKKQQVDVAQEVLKKQGPGAWPVCSRRAGLTVQNGLATEASPETGGGGGGSQEPIKDEPLVVDGKLGRQTYGAIERWVKGSINGSLSSTDRKKLQAKVGAKADGVIGAKTIAALQKTIGMKANGASKLSDRSTVLNLQKYLNQVLYGGDNQPTPPPTPAPKPGELAVDGKLGPKTRAAAEKWFAGSVNGSWSTADVKKLQAKVGATADGKIGPKTVKALQVTIEMKPNGARSLDTATVKAFQRYLNKVL